MPDEKPIPGDEWKTIVENVPLVSVDLIVRHEGGVLLGRRQNEPARGEWFVPGGTVLKNERLAEAVDVTLLTDLLPSVGRQALQSDEIVVGDPREAERLRERFEAAAPVPSHGALSARLDDSLAGLDTAIEDDAPRDNPDSE